MLCQPAGYFQLLPLEFVTDSYFIFSLLDILLMLVMIFTTIGIQCFWPCDWRRSCWSVSQVQGVFLNSSTSRTICDKSELVCWSSVTIYFSRFPHLISGGCEANAWDGLGCIQIFFCLDKAYSWYIEFYKVFQESGPVPHGLTWICFIVCVL